MNFLIIGGMKCGTTSLYSDLLSNDKVFLPAVKEPELLIDFQNNRRLFESRVRRLYGAAGRGQLLGEASTAYTKHPLFDGVAQAAVEAYGKELKLIYMTRCPAERARSHFDHERAAGRVSGSLAEWLREVPAGIEFSRYHYQAEQWLLEYPEESLLTLSLEAYKSDRETCLAYIRSFLGLPQSDHAKLSERYQKYPTQIDAFHRNKTSGKLVSRNPLISAVVQSRFYGETIKPMIPESFRLMAKKSFYKRNEYQSSPIDCEAKEILRSAISDVDRKFWEKGSISNIRERLKNAS